MTNASQGVTRPINSVRAGVMAAALAVAACFGAAMSFANEPAEAANTTDQN
ncbi:hypothetical protein P7228_08600 [Altererythrobacter arenosus]|uniref:Uncharacterized protein n=1 Tax=Altererythrobacter arenosus TaxID=3032592 RepID=A0ABY8FRN6_9SPHN|nr:hypothetical protein [Altererythrobacter sp. CAU 1644]WFL76066.1 hypothetical protein P7228_08600 [Altererythrobacter sp. CAU 1644]